MVFVFAYQSEKHAIIFNILIVWLLTISTGQEIVKYSYIDV